jgi:hypothetical protein
VKVVDYENSCYIGPPKQQYEIHFKMIKTIYKKQSQVPPTNQWKNNFSASPPENTLAVPDPNQPPIQTIRKGSCIYPPAKGPPQPIKRDKSCEYDSSQSQMQSSKKEKVIRRKEKSCRYT